MIENVFCSPAQIFGPVPDNNVCPACLHIKLTGSNCMISFKVSTPEHEIRISIHNIFIHRFLLVLGIFFVEAIESYSLC